MNCAQNKTLINGATYYPQVVGISSVYLYEKFSDYTAGINEPPKRPISDEEVAHAYYAAFNAICNEAENIKNISYKNKRIKEAKKSLDAVIRHMNPINVSDEGRYRIDSKRNEFLNWLSPKNKKLALDLEKTYHVKIRRLKRIINSSKWRDKYSVYPY